MAATRVRNAAISAALWLSLLPYSSYVALAPLIQAEWSATHAQTGAVYAAYLAGYAVAAVFVVPRLDRTGPTRFWRIGLLLMGAAHFGFTVLPPGWLSALPLRAAAGAGHVVAMTAAVQIVSGSVRHDRRAAALGLLIAAGYLGTTSSYLITGAALSLFGNWRLAYRAVTAIALLGLLPALAGVGVTPAPAPAAGRGARLDWRLLRRPRIGLAIGAYAWHSAELFLMRLWLPLLLAELWLRRGATLDAATGSAARLAGVLFMLGAAGVFSGGRLADRFGRVRTATAIYAASVACGSIIGWTLGAPPLLIALGAGLAVLTAADSAIYTTLLVEAAPAGQVGTVQALQAATGFSLSAIWPVIAGAALDLAGPTPAWGPLFSMNSAIIALGLLALRRLSRHQSPAM